MATFGFTTSFEPARSGARSGARSAPAWDVYLIGDGYSLHAYHPPDIYAPNPPRQQLVVPADITVLLYTPAGGVTDDDVENQVVGRDEAAPLAFEPIVVPANNPDGVAEHILVFPSLRSGFRLEEMIPIKKFGFYFLNLRSSANQDRASLKLNEPLRNRCALYIGNPLPMVATKLTRRNCFLGNYAYLSDILQLIAKQHKPTKVHWLACRSDYPVNSAKFYAQASGRFGFFGDYDNINQAAMLGLIGQVLG